MGKGQDLNNTRGRIARIFAIGALHSFVFLYLIPFGVNPRFEGTQARVIVALIALVTLAITLLIVFSTKRITKSN